MPRGADPPSRKETIRSAIRRALAEGQKTLRELSSEVQVSERDLPDHLEHLDRSLRAEGRALAVEPPRCRQCGFTFQKRARLTRPGKCPQCRATRVSLPRASLESSSSSSGGFRTPSARARASAVDLGDALGNDGIVELRDEQRRAVIAMCCAVARADGEVSPPELEALFDVLVRFGGGLIAYTELERWLAEGPPSPEAAFREEDLRACIQNAVAVAQADGKIDQAEIDTIKRYGERYLGQPGR